MSVQRVERILAWMKGTDLVEVHYFKKGETISLRIADTQTPVELPPSPLVPVTSPGVGVFRFSEPGHPRAAERDVKVKKGRRLGLIDSGRTRLDVSSPANGRIVRVLVEDGQAVDYGRPLFLIEPVFMSEAHKK